MRRILAVFFVLSTLAAAQDLRLPALFSDGMVLQRHRDVAVWGWASPGQSVHISTTFGARATASADAATGLFIARIKTIGASAGHEVTIRSGGASKTLKDVLIGDVWLCSGQSNMEWAVRATASGYADRRAYERELEDANMPRMRLFTVRNAIAPRPVDDVEGSWVAATASTVESFSAVGFHFGKSIQRHLGVPVGLIAADWGGTVCESWTSRSAIEAHGGFEAGLASVDDQLTDQSGSKQRLADRRAAWWAKNGGDAAWTGTDFDASEWMDFKVPGLWESTPVGNFDGFLFARRSIDLPEDFVGRELILELGAVDDMDTTWFNGRRVGGMERPGAWNVGRRYVIPANLVKAGSNVIAVRCLDTGGAGGFSGKPAALSLRRSDGAGQRVGVSGTWKARKGSSTAKLPPFPTGPRFHANMPTALFNGMIAPLLPYGLRGFTWYQGESNIGRALQYRTLFPTMIKDWRARFGQGDLPFYFVQLAPYGYGGDRGAAAELREAQFMTLSLPNTGMAVTMDVGDPKDIHPRDKKTVGRRLARWALAHEYGVREIAYSGPLYKGMAVEAATIRLRFDHAEGLMARGGAPSHFTIAGKDGKFVPATAKIDGQTVVVSSPNVKEPAAVRYGWGAADEPNLFNGAGLPASSFRTDDLPRSLQRR